MTIVVRATVLYSINFSADRAVANLCRLQHWIIGCERFALAKWKRIDNHPKERISYSDWFVNIV